MADRFETHGDFSWCELLTNDVDSAKKFYAELLGWTMEDQPMGEGVGNYTILKADGRPVGGIMKMPPQVPAGTPPHWGTYVTIDDVDAVAARLQKLGGKVLVPPSDSPDSRFCVFQDPQGAVLSIISYTKKPE
jgi:predicted enzyme related to lactoylglutathione lyase